MSSNEEDQGPDGLRYEKGSIVIGADRAEAIEREQAAAKRDEKYKDNQLDTNRRMVLFTFALVLVSAVSGGISIWQATIAQRSANAARDAVNIANKTMRLAYRPRITLLGINPTVMRLQVNGSIRTTLDKNRLHVGIDIPNTGPFAARNVRFFRYDNVSPRDMVTRLPYRELLGQPKTIPPKPDGFGGITITGERIITPSELSGLEKGTWSPRSPFSLAMTMTLEKPTIQSIAICSRLTVSTTFALGLFKTTDPKNGPVMASKKWPQTHQCAKYVSARAKCCWS